MNVIQYDEEKKVYYILFNNQRIEHKTQKEVEAEIEKIKKEESLNNTRKTTKKIMK